MLIAMRMGNNPDASNIDMTAMVEVLPRGAEQRLLVFRKDYPGYDVKYFSLNLDDVKDLKVKAGTEGTIEFTVWVEYTFLEWEHQGWGILSGPAHFQPAKRDETVQCTCSWNYTCTPEGELSLRAFDPEDSPSSDHYTLVVGKADFAMPKPTTGRPYVKMTSKSDYAGYNVEGESIGVGPFSIQGNGVSAQPSSKFNPALVAYLTITDKVIPPTPKPAPVPAREFLMPLLTVIPFNKEGQRDLDREARSIAMEWAQSMFQRYPALQVPIAHGDIPVYFFGYASMSGPVGEKDTLKVEEYNQKIGNDRADNVIKYLKPNLLGGKADVTPISFGRQYSEWAKVWDEKLKKAVRVVGKPRDVDRIVVVYVDYEKADQVINKKK
jgi:hypothetical protein